MRDEHKILAIGILAVALLGAMVMNVRSEEVARAKWSPAAMNTTIDKTNFLVNRGCSGTILASGDVLTAAHCVKDQYEIVERQKIGDDGKVTEEKIRIARPGTVTQKFFKGPAESMQTSYVYKLVDVDYRVDLALLRLQADVPVPIGAITSMACAPLARGDTVYAVGNSFAILYSSVSKGMVGSTQRSYRDLEIAGQLGDATDDGEHGLVQHTALIAPGNSGGALYTEDGHFVGVNVRGGSGFAFAVPYEDVKEFLVHTKLERLFEHGVSKSGEPQ